MPTNASLADQFDDYVAKVYSEELPADQLREIRSAFMAGVCLAYASRTNYSYQIKSFFNTMEAALAQEESGHRNATDAALDRWMSLYRSARKGGK